MLCLSSSSVHFRGLLLLGTPLQSSPGKLFKCDVPIRADLHTSICCTCHSPSVLAETFPDNAFVPAGLWVISLTCLVAVSYSLFKLPPLAGRCWVVLVWSAGCNNSGRSHWCGILSGSHFNGEEWQGAEEMLTSASLTLMVAFCLHLLLCFSRSFSFSAPFSFSFYLAIYHPTSFREWDFFSSLFPLFFTWNVLPVTASCFCISPPYNACALLLPFPPASAFCTASHAMTVPLPIQTGSLTLWMECGSGREKLPDLDALYLYLCLSCSSSRAVSQSCVWMFNDDDAFQTLWPCRLICTPCAVNSFIVRRVIDLSKDAPADLAQQMFYFIPSHCVCMKGALRGAYTSPQGHTEAIIKSALLCTLTSCRVT